MKINFAEQSIDGKKVKDFNEYGKWRLKDLKLNKFVEQECMIFRADEEAGEYEIFEQDKDGGIIFDGSEIKTKVIKHKCKLIRKGK